MAQIEDILTHKIIPWAERDPLSRIIVARRSMKQAQMPSGVKIEQSKKPSRRVAVKNRRVYNNVRNIIAVWPDAGLHELAKYTLICIVNGYINYPISRYRLSCGPGYFIFIPPGVPQSDGSQSYLDSERSNSCDTMSFVLQPGAIDVWTSHGHSKGRERDNECLFTGKYAVNLFEMLIDEAVQKNEPDKILIQQLLGAFSRVILREVQKGDFQHVNLPQHVAERMARSNRDDFCQHLENYVTTNLEKPLRFNNVASDMFLSPAQFARVIRRETGKSFTEYLTEKRLQKAKKLLIGSEWAVKTISEMCGFSSVEYFCLVFKKHTQKTPSQYRNPRKMSK